MQAHIFKLNILGILSLGLFSASLFAEPVWTSGSVQVVHKSTIGQADYGPYEIESQLVDNRADWVEEKGTWQEYDCSVAMDSRTLEQKWYGYFRASDPNTKASALNSAIASIGERRAAYIVDQAPASFTPVPRSWNEFKTEVWKIERNLKLYGLYQEVVVSNGMATMKALGYLPEEKGAPQAQTQTTEDAWAKFQRAHPNDVQNKIILLQQAIEGIDETDAKKILYKDWKVDSPKQRSEFFPGDKKPKSWEEFKAELGKVDTALSNTRSSPTEIYQKAIVKNGSKNRESLYPKVSSGPQSDSEARAYRRITRTDYHYVLGPVKEVVLQMRTASGVHVKISGSRLLPSEVEIFKLSFNGANDNLSIDTTSALNGYQVSSQGRHLVDLVATGRRPVRPDAKDFHVSLLRAGPGFEISMNDSKADELSKLSSGLQWKLHYVLKKKASPCKSDQVVGQGDLTMTQNGEKKGIEGQSDSGTYYLQNVTVERIGTDFYSQASGEIGTQALKGN
jgi:hypothetical protein